MQLTNCRIDKPDATNLICSDRPISSSPSKIHETLRQAAMPEIKFGLAFCEASGKCLVRSSRH